MKRLFRPELNFEQRTRLFKSQREYVALMPPLRDKYWKNSRQWKSTQALVNLLEAMSGPRENCFYCGNGVATDIEHYYPRADFPEKAFQWKNWLWVCGQCNRQKSSSATIAAASGGRVLDPTCDDPWEFFFFDETTGRIEPRWVSPSVEDPHAAHTLNVLKNLNSERRENQRRKTASEIKTAIRLVLKDSDNLPGVRDLVRLVREDASGVAQWYFWNEVRYPNAQSIVSALRAHHPSIWKACIRKAR